MRRELENREERRIEVPVLDDRTIREQVAEIVDLGIPPKKRFLEKLRELYVGPGLRVVFYHSKSAIAIGFLLYPVILDLITMVGYHSLYREYLTLMAFPMLHLILLILTNWAEEDEHMVEVKWGLPYTAAHMIGLRMFYISIFTAVANSLLLPVVYGWYETRLALMGISSIFLFSIVMLLMVERMWSYYRMILFGAAWSLICLVCAYTAGGLRDFLFGTVPLAVHIVITVGCFLGMLFMVGKVGRKNAFACKYS